ncbi:MAG: zinc ribbon domain-containing protein [Clostridia bacterium]|nr:zinc ribbon domain-containing protein [Clostridia bacterium]
MKICPKCQTECSDDAVFCAKCGSDLPAAAPAEEAAPETPAFCPKCGRKLEPGTTFCPGCGNNLTGKAKAGAAPAIITDTLGTVKGYATGKPVEAVEKAAQSKGLSWIIFAALTIISFMFAVPTVVRTTLSRVMRGSMMKMARELAKAFDQKIDADARKSIRESARDFAKNYSWGYGLLWSFLIGAFAFFATCLAFYLVVKVFLKKDVRISGVFNAVAAATLPLTFAFLLSMVLALVWWPLAACLTGCAAIASLVLLYKGFCGLAAFDKKPVMAFICAMLLAFIPVCIVAGLVADIQTVNLFYNSGMGSMGGLL